MVSVLVQNGILAAAAIGPAVLADVAVAQGAVRVYGDFRHDTAAFARGAVDVVAFDYMTAGVRTDGTIVLLGSTSLGDPPPPPVGTPFRRVAVGSRFAYGLLADGTLVGWGDSPPPVPALPPNVTYTKVAVGNLHAIALRSDGQAVAWGGNTAGQTAVPTLPGGVTVVDVFAGPAWSILLRSDGVLSGFGSSSAILPPPIAPAGTGFTEAWIGRSHGFARRSDGVVVGWGDGSAGQLAPPPLPAGVRWLEFAAGTLRTAARASDGRVVAFGSSYFGDLTVPPLPSGTACVQLAAAERHFLARFADGSVLGWGNAGFAVPTALPAGASWRAIASGGSVLALAGTGAVYDLSSRTVVPPLPSGMHWKAIASGGRHAVALRSDGRAVAWGENTHGQLAIPPLPHGMWYRAIAASDRATVLIRSDGSALATAAGPGFPALPAGVGYTDVAVAANGTALLLRSDGSVVDTVSPPTGQVPVLPPGVRFVAVARGDGWDAALRSDGLIETWGAPFVQALPPLPPGVVYVGFAANDVTLLARRSDGRVVAATRVVWDPAAAVPAPRPGESVLAARAGFFVGAVLVGSASAYTTVAAGCAGTRPITRLVPGDVPQLGRHLELRLFDLPQDLAVLAFGWQRTPPQALATFGLPGCFQHSTLDATLLLAGAGGQARVWLPIPAVPSLLGLTFHNQALVFDPAANAAGAVVSDAATAVVGGV